MRELLHRFSVPAILLFAFLALTQAVNGFLYAAYLETPTIYQLLEKIGFVWLFAWWLQQDSRKRQIGWVLDMGMWLWIAWPVIIPYHLIKTRGRRAWIPVVAFIGTSLLAIMLGMAVHAAFFI